MTVMWDFLSSAAPTTTASLAVTPQKVIVVKSSRNQIVNTGVDESEEIVSLSTKYVYVVTLQFNAKNATDIGTLFNWFHDADYGDGISNSWVWNNPDAADGHNYTVRFSDPRLSERIQLASIYGLDVDLKVLGRYEP